MFKVKSVVWGWFEATGVLVLGNGFVQVDGAVRDDKPFQGGEFVINANDVNMIVSIQKEQSS